MHEFHGESAHYVTVACGCGKETRHPIGQVDPRQVTCQHAFAPTEDRAARCVGCELTIPLTVLVLAGIDVCLELAPDSPRKEHKIATINHEARELLAENATLRRRIERLEAMLARKIEAEERQRAPLHGIGYAANKIF